MGLMDKFKNLFTDEEVIEEDDDEVEIKEVTKEEPKLPTFMREKIAEEEKEQPDVIKNIKIEPEEVVNKEIKLEKKLDEKPVEAFQSDEKQPFKFPIDLNDSDFSVSSLSRGQKNYTGDDKGETVKFNPQVDSFREKKHVNVEKKETKVSELYKDKKEEKQKEEKKFRATPIISPIYGVVDKNYDPDEVENNKGRNFENNRPSKNVDFDSVRKKAYGNVAKEIQENLMCENCEYLKEAKDCKKREKKYVEEPCYREEYENITLDEATENYYDYGVAYEKQPVKSEKGDDRYYLDDEVEDDNGMVAVNDYSVENEAPKKHEIPPVKNSINLLSTLKKSMGDDEEVKKEKNLELTDDLFNIIDSMYDERNDG